MDFLKFEKWHGTGNDFIVYSEQATLAVTSDINALAVKMCDRHFGIGSDGLILVGKSEQADFRMRMWNPDGSESEMCGNGLRCVAAHLLKHGLIDSASSLKIETMKRTITVDFPDRPEWADFGIPWVRLDMGAPVLERKDIPVSGDGPSPVINDDLKIPGHDIDLKFTAVNFGNPHAVVFTGDADSVPLDKWGPALENYTDLFPNRINIEFVQVIDPGHVKMRVWERGAGITLSCGSGVTAVQAACYLTGNASDRLRVDVPGGSLMTEFTEDSRVLLSGPAEFVFAGYWSKN